MNKVFANKDLLVQCLGPLLTLQERSSFARVCRHVYMILRAHDASLKFLLPLWNVPGLSIYHKQESAIACGSLEIVKFFVMKHDNEKYPAPYLDILANDPASFAKTEVYRYLLYLMEHGNHMDSEHQFSVFKRIVKRAAMHGFTDFACSLFTNKNNAWFSAEYFSELMDEFEDELEKKIIWRVWAHACMRSSLDEIKCLEPVFGQSSANHNISHCCDTRGIWKPDVFDYFWNKQTAVTSYDVSRIGTSLYQGDNVSKSQFEHICLRILEKCNKIALDPILSAVKQSHYRFKQQSEFINTFNMILQMMQ